MGVGMLSEGVRGVDLWWAGQLTPMEAIETRHSVRSYTEKPLDGAAVETLRAAIDAVSEEANLNIQLVLNEPRAFSGFKARLVNFTGVRNYLALIGPECKELDGILGYYGERLVLLAQSLGLNSCWVGGLQGGESRLQRGSGGEAGCRGGLGLWYDPGRAPQVQGSSGGGRGPQRCPRLV